MSLKFAYLAQGKLYVKDGNQAVREIESEFGQSVQDRRLQVERRQAMRNRGIQAMVQSPQTNQPLEPSPEAVAPANITSLCRFGTDQLLYALELAELGGLFRYSSAEQREHRIFHNTEFYIGHLDYSPTHQLLACTKTYPTGISNLATLNPNHHRSQDLTEGDSIDLAPRWIDHKPKAIVYQSAGVSRNSQGLVINRTPFSVIELDFKKQDVMSLADDPKSDLLGPQCTADGWLYYIRRPYKSFGGELNFIQLLKDILLLPLRLIYAFFQFFNIFSEMMTGRPLINAVTRQKSDRRPLRTLGGLFLPENLPKKHAGEAEAPALVPSSWQLVRQGAQGVPEVLAQHVLSYDLAADGSVLYTNGSAVYKIQVDGKGDLLSQSPHERLLIGKWIESVIILSESSESQTAIP